MKKKPTVGKVATDLLAKPEIQHTVIDQMRENLTDYDKNIFLCVEQAKKTFPGDFYVVVECKKERLLHNVIRNYFFARHSCPTPTWDQTVYKYHKDREWLEFLWVIPSQDACEYLTINKHYVAESEYELLKFVLSYNDGTLLEQAKKLNGEADNSPLIEGIV
jgi:hypothetical protein